MFSRCRGALHAQHRCSTHTYSKFQLQDMAVMCVQLTISDMDLILLSECQVSDTGTKYIVKSPGNMGYYDRYSSTRRMRKDSIYLLEPTSVMRKLSRH